MTLLLAVAMATNLAPGCHTIGSTVHCELAPPKAAERPAPPAVASPSDPRFAAIGHAHQAHTNRRRAERGAAGSQAPGSVTDDVTVQAHIASLVSIGDCTGAKTYATLIGKTALADQTFKDCAGVASAVPANLASAP